MPRAARGETCSRCRSTAKTRRSRSSRRICGTCAAGGVCRVDTDHARGGARFRAAGRWDTKRIGADPPAAEVELLGRAFTEVVSACGAPAVLFSERGDGTARREAFRQFMHSTLEPIARLIALELTAKLEADVSINLDRLFAADPCRPRPRVSIDGGRRHGPRQGGRARRAHGVGSMTAVRDLADELKLTNVSVRHHCRRGGIDTHRRLPDGARGGQCIAFVTDEDAAASGSTTGPARGPECWRARTRDPSRLALLHEDPQLLRLGKPRPSRSDLGVPKPT